MVASGFLNGLLGGQGYDVFTLLIGAIAVAGYAVSGFRTRLARITYQQPVESFPLFVARVVLVGAVVMDFAWQLAHARGLPVVLIILAVLVLAYGVVTRSTVFGRQVYAIGGNLSAAHAVRRQGPDGQLLDLRQHGLAVRGRRGHLLRRGPTAPSPAPATCSSSTRSPPRSSAARRSTGGVGTVVGAMVGGLIMAVMSNGMQLMGIDQSIQSVVKGLVLLLAVAFDIYNKRRAGAAR